MVNLRLIPGAYGCGLALLAAVLIVPSSFAEQATSAPPQAVASAGADLAPAVQAQFNKFEDTLKAARAAGDANAEVAALNQIGHLHYLTSDYHQGLKNFTEALDAARSAKNAIEEAKALNGVASCNRELGQNDKAVEIFHKALDVATASGDLRGQAEALNGMGWARNNQDKNDEAMTLHKQALPLAVKLGDTDLQALILNRIGQVYDATDDQANALKTYTQALELWQSAGDQRGQGVTLGNIGIVYAEQGDKLTALDYMKKSLPFATATGNRASAAKTMLNIGVVYKLLGDKQKALGYYEQALPFLDSINDTLGESVALLNLGNLYGDLERSQDAMDAYRRGLELSRQMGSVSTEAGVLVGMGNQENVLGQMQKALDDLKQALTLWRSINGRKGEATTLNSIGIVYDNLGDKKDALDYYTQSLTIQHEIGNNGGEAVALSNIAGIYSEPSEKQRSLDYYNRALALYRTDGDDAGVSLTQNNMGLVYGDLHDYRRALESLNEALRIRQSQSASGDGDVGTTLNNIGDVYDGLGDKQKALEFHLKALPLSIAAGDPLRAALVFRSLMLNLKSTQPAMAIFYGKQAVNCAQRVRSNIQGMDRQLQSSFLASQQEDYRDLADLLITQGRLPEAQQVLDIIKQQEYRDYVRGATGDAMSPLALTPAEQQAEEEYQQSTAQLVSLGEQWTQLRQLSQRTPEQEKTFQDLSARLDSASKGLNDYYARLYVLFGKNNEANKQLADVKGTVSELEEQIGETPHTAALYTMVTADHYRVLVITAAATVAREYAIPMTELNRKVAEFEEALRDPEQDPRPMGRELYNILIGPVKADLDQAHAETLVWSLDGILRYVPIAALYDGKHYLVETYNSVTITPAFIAHLSDKPDVSNLTALAMGISHQYEQDLPALPAVADELSDVVKDAQVNGADGVLPGTILLNGQFTEKAMETQLSAHRQVVHIASHFVFMPGDDSKSYLLLAGKDENGTGYHLTVEDFRDNRNLELRHTDLLTLSACETGVSGSAGNGREVDGLGTTAQQKGARAVISSLWAVNDSSTGRLMADFYQRWADGAGKVTKVEALRQAQLDLLLGRPIPNAGSRGRPGATTRHDQDPPPGYTHPFFWAPFVLMGNWR
ncbi:MAG: tetratricopeptide repeat protein [Terracidiphilus sp.]|jgi:CHAT domain-containing protein